MMIEQLFHRKKYSAPFTERIDIGVYQLLAGGTKTGGSVGAGEGTKQDYYTFGAKPLPTSLWDEEPEDLWDEEPEESEEELDNLWR